MAQPDRDQAMLTKPRPTTRVGNVHTVLEQALQLAVDQRPAPLEINMVEASPCTTATAE